MTASYVFSFSPKNFCGVGRVAVLSFVISKTYCIGGFKFQPKTQLLPMSISVGVSNHRSRIPFGDNRDVVISRRYHPRHQLCMTSSLQQPTDDTEKTFALGGNETAARFTDVFTDNSAMDELWGSIQEKIGAVSSDRIYYPELASGDVPRLFSHLKYSSAVAADDDNNRNNKSTAKRIAIHAAGSTLGAAALVAGTTIGAGVLALPAATISSGFIPSSLGLCFAWGYMTISGLLLAELSINRIGETGRPGLGILDLYQTYLGGEQTNTVVASPQRLLPLGANVAYFFLHYAMLVAYISQGGQNLVDMFGNEGFLGNSVVLSQGLFAAVTAVALFFASNYPALIRNVNSALVVGVLTSFLGLVCIGLPTVNVPELINPLHQHPENVMNAFPVMVLSLVFQNIVPTVVTQLECDRRKITQAIVGGTLVPLVMFLLWNAVILGNMYNGNDIAKMSTSNPVSMLQAAATASGSNIGLLSDLVLVFSELAIVTSLIGFVYGLISAWTDVLKLPTSGIQYEQQLKPFLFGAVFLPPLAVVASSNGNPDIFIQALDYGGAFGVSTLFLLLPPFMVWNSRYTDTEKQNLATLPLMPGGKLALGSLWKASGTLIIEQGLEKLGVFTWFHDTFLK